jgi:hypothetical protein
VTTRELYHLLERLNPELLDLPIVACDDLDQYTPDTLVLTDYESSDCIALVSRSLTSSWPDGDTIYPPEGVTFAG